MKLTAHQEGTTKDIMYSLVSAAPAAVNQYESLPNNLQFIQPETKDLNKIGKAACRYIRNLVKYKIDPYGVQNIQLPAKLIENGEGDCKSLSLFLYAVLTSLGYKGGFRFARYRVNGSFTHVYNYFFDENGKLFTFDACTKSFDEIKPLEKYDMEINYIAEAPVITRRKPVKRYIIQSRKPRLVDLLQDDRVMDAQPRLQGIGKKKFFGKWKDKFKGALDKVGKGIKKAALAPARGPFLVLVNVNFRGIARKLDSLRTKNQKKFNEFWLKLGGDIDALNKAVNKGKGKKPFLGEKKGVKGFDLIDNTGIGDIYEDIDGIGIDPVTITTAIAAASAIIAAANKLFKGEGIGPKPEEGDPEAGIPVPEEPITEPGQDFVATDPASEEAAKYAITKKTPAPRKKKPSGEYTTATEVAAGVTTGFRPSPMLLIGGAAALGLVLFTMKKKK
jgi:hypothetical protein